VRLLQEVMQSTLVPFFFPNQGRTTDRRGPQPPRTMIYQVVQPDYGILTEDGGEDVLQTRMALLLLGVEMKKDLGHAPPGRKQ